MIAQINMQVTYYSLYNYLYVSPTYLLTLVFIFIILAPAVASTILRNLDFHISLKKNNVT